MTLQAPLPLPDELLSSALIRCCKHHLISTQTLGGIVLGLPNWQPRPLSIPKLHLMERLFRLPAERLVADHTVFYYTTAFMHSQSYELSRSYLAPGARSEGLGALVQSASLGSFGWRYCGECAKGDVDSFGTSYWRRAHNLPGVAVCHIHERPLRATARLISKAGLPLSLPHELEATSPIKRGVSAFQLELARQSAAALRPSRPFASSFSPQWYRDLAVNQGLLPRDAPFRADALSALVVNLAGETLLAQAAIVPATANPWPSLMVRHGVIGPFAPLKHLILNIALAQKRVPDSQPLAHRSSGPPGTADEQLDHFYSEAAKAELRSLLARGEKGVTTETFLRRVGCWGAYRHRMSGLPRLRRVVLHFRASEASVKPLLAGRTLYRTRPHEVVP